MEVKIIKQEDIAKETDMRETFDEADNFDGWNAEAKLVVESDDNGSGLVARPSTVPISEPNTLLDTIRSLGDVNPALMVSVSISPIFQVDRPYRLKFNNISDEKFRELFWSSTIHEVTAICVDYNSWMVTFVTGYQSFLDGTKGKVFNLTAENIDKYDIHFVEYRTADEPSPTSLIDKAEKEN